jgi:hypothetical protein
VKIGYDKLAPPRVHPLSKGAVRALLAGLPPEAREAVEHLRAIRFGWNQRTTQEGQVAQREDDAFEIRINFTVANGESRLIRDDPPWLKAVRRCGGTPDLRTGIVTWPDGAAARYTAFVLLHELAHIVYALRHHGGVIEGEHSPGAEELWCDAWALAHTPA